jgi:hypothetical protein
MELQRKFVSDPRALWLKHGWLPAVDLNLNQSRAYGRHAPSVRVTAATDSTVELQMSRLCVLGKHHEAAGSKVRVMGVANFACTVFSTQRPTARASTRPDFAFRWPFVGSLVVLLHFGTHVPF